LLAKPPLINTGAAFFASRAVAKHIFCEPEYENAFYMVKYAILLLNQLLHFIEQMASGRAIL
jgi:hypothetical protein